MSKKFNTVFTDSTGFAVLVSLENISEPKRTLGTGQGVWDLRLCRYKFGKKDNVEKAEGNL